MKVITFSRFFPAYHPRKGQPTYFVEKIWKGLYEDNSDVPFPHEMAGIWSAYCEMDVQPKHHTIRAGHRWKVGDWFSPRVWSGKPYRSKQAEIGEPLQIKKIWMFRLSHDSYYLDEQELYLDDLTTVAKNDGLTTDDFESWFPYRKEFSGQILCWNESIEYAEAKTTVQECDASKVDSSTKALVK